MPGMIATATGTITALTGLVAALHQTGLLGKH
jgi:hypothetical protein